MARAVEAAHPDRLDEQAALLAHHYEAAGEALEAARWHRRAAEWQFRSELPGGVNHWERVYELAKSGAATPEATELLIAACGMLVVTERDLAAWSADGRLVVVEDVIEGLENAPRGLIGLLAGENRGKRMIRVGPDPRS